MTEQGQGWQEEVLASKYCTFSCSCTLKCLCPPEWGEVALLPRPGKGEFSDRMDAGRIISVPSLVPFALCTQRDPVPTPAVAHRARKQSLF